MKVAEILSDFTSLRVCVSVFNHAIIAFTLHLETPKVQAQSTWLKQMSSN
jgi:hypothetical protein